MNWEQKLLGTQREISCEPYLSDREYKILQLRYGEGLTLEETGKILSITRERVRQIESKALLKLRKQKETILCADLMEEEKMLVERHENIIRQLREHVDFLTELLNWLEQRPLYEDEFLSLKGQQVYDDRPIEDLDFSIRAYNCLRRAGIEKVGDFKKFSVEELMKIRNLGRKSLREIVFKLQENGIRLKENTILED